MRLHPSMPQPAKFLDEADPFTGPKYRVYSSVQLCSLHSDQQHSLHHSVQINCEYQGTMLPAVCLINVCVRILGPEGDQ